MALQRFDAYHRLEVEGVEVGERPPMATVSGYRSLTSTGLNRLTGYQG
jgi:hypothetical protein